MQPSALQASRNPCHKVLTQRPRHIRRDWQFGTISSSIDTHEMERPYHVVVWGATGFVGKLVCEHIARDYQARATSGIQLHMLKREQSVISKSACLL